MKKFLITTFTLALLIGIWSVSYAQEEAGSLTGIVTDSETGEPLVGARVKIQLCADCGGDRHGGNGHGHHGGNGGGNHAYYATTGEDGSYIIEDVPIGIYTVVAMKRMYVRQEAEVEILANEVITLDFALEPRVCEGNER